MSVLRDSALQRSKQIPKHLHALQMCTVCKHMPCSSCAQLQWLKALHVRKLPRYPANKLCKLCCVLHRHAAYSDVLRRCSRSCVVAHEVHQDPLPSRRVEVKWCFLPLPQVEFISRKTVNLRYPSCLFCPPSHP